MATLIFIAGDQLSLDVETLQTADKSRDIVIMAEVESEIRRFPSHKQRIVLFLSAMRHFRDRLEEAGFQVEYQSVGAENAASSLPLFVEEQIHKHDPDRIVMTEAGRFDLEQKLCEVVESNGKTIEILPDPHFLCTREEFAEWALGRKTLVMEYFYREMRKRHGYLMEGGKPVGGDWNFDKENRGRFGNSGPGLKADPYVSVPDKITQEVISLVEERFDSFPGSVNQFHWPVTPEEAQKVLDGFIELHLPSFGTYQDAMWTGEPFLFHSRLSAALNLKLIDPRDVIKRVLDAYRERKAPINAVEGFVRQNFGMARIYQGGLLATNARVQ